MDEQMLKKMDNLFHIVYTMAKSEVKFTFFEKFIFCHTKISDGKSDLGVTYHNDKSCSIFTHFIGKDICESLCMKLRNSRFFSLMIDESTDKCTTTKLILFVMFMDEGEASSHFLTLANLATTTSSDITKAIDLELSSNLNFPQWKEKLVSLGTDGASVMTGRKSGVGESLKESSPWLINIHCMAHRLELAIKSAFSNTYMNTIEMIMRKIYSFYSRSPKRRAALKDIALICKEHVVVPQRLDGVRWIPHHYSACQGMINNWKVIVMHFENISSTGTGDEKTLAKVILKHCMTYIFLYNLHFFTDVLGDISRLSLCIQTRNVTLHQVMNRLRSVKENLNDMKIGSGLNLQDFTDNVVETDTNCTFKDHTLKKLSVNSHALNKVKIIDGILEAIDERFSSMAEEGIPKYSTIFEVANWPVDTEELKQYGQLELSALIQQFKIPLQKAGVELLNIMGEFSELKQDAINSHKSDLKKGSRHFWKRMHLEKFEIYKNILSLTEICMLLPVSTSCCERGFSFLKRIQGDWRNSLGLSTLNALMTIELEGPKEEDFNPRSAVLRWHNEKVRNPERKPYGKRKRTDDEQVDEDEESEDELMD